MGAKNSKREAPHGSLPLPSGSPSSKILRTRSLPSKLFSRRLRHDYGRFLRGKPLVEDDVDGLDPIEEFERLVELEKLHGEECTGFSEKTKQDFTRSYISSLQGSREEIIYIEEEEEDDDDDNEGFVAAAGDHKHITPAAELSGSPPCFCEILAEPDYRVERRQLLDALVIGTERAFPLPKLRQTRTLVLWDEHDEIFNLELAHKLRKHLGKSSEIEIMKNYGHVPQLEDPKEYNRIILEFLSKPLVPVVKKAQVTPSSL